MTYERDRIINCLVAGVGGQGTVLASKLIAATALEKGFAVRTTETIGMAQRGGSVVSHVRMGERAFSPLIPKGAAQMILAFEPAEAVRLWPYLTPDGVVVSCDSPLKPVTSSLAGNTYQGQTIIDFLRAQVDNLIIVSGDAVRERCGGLKALNVALLGVAAGCGVLPFDAVDLEKTVLSKIPARFRDLNLTALALGRELYEAQSDTLRHLEAGPRKGT